MAAQCLMSKPWLYFIHLSGLYICNSRTYYTKHCRGEARDSKHRGLCRVILFFYGVISYETTVMLRHLPVVIGVVGPR